MKKLVLCIVIALVSLQTSAQRFDSLFVKGNSFVSVGYNILGLRSVLRLGVQGPIQLQYEYAITNRIGIGLVGSIGRYFYDESTDSVAVVPLSGPVAIQNRVKGEYYSTLFQLNYHIDSDKFRNDIWKDLDIYLGGRIGYFGGRFTNEHFFEINGNEEKYPYESDGELNFTNELDYDLQIGFRFYVREHIGFYGELSAFPRSSQFGMVIKW